MGRAQSVHSDCNLKNMFVFGLGMYFSNHDTSTVHKILIVNYPPLHVQISTLRTQMNFIGGVSKFLANLSGIG